MKRTLHHLMTACVAVAFVIGATAGTAAAKSNYPAEMDAWLKKAQLGPYQPKKEDWDAIVRKATEEGEVIVYSSTSRISKIGKSFMKKYPGIKVKGYDLGSVQSVEKTIREQSAGIYSVDIVTTAGDQVIPELLNKNRIINYVPNAYLNRIPKKFRDPLLPRSIGAMAFMYNGEAHPDKAPVNNIWEFTEPKWRGRIAMKNPPNSLTTFLGVAIIVQNADKMAAAYKLHTGKPIKLSKGIANAGYEFWYRLLKNDVVIFKSGSKMSAAVGKKGLKRPFISFDNMSRLGYNKRKGYVLRAFVKLEPVGRLTYLNYLGIARQAPHPNAAKLMVAYILGSTKINKDTKLEPPYTKGKSLKLLQGFAPFFVPGNISPRSDMPLPKGGEVWHQMKGWVADPDYLWSEGPKIRDFWIKYSAK